MVNILIPIIFAVYVQLGNGQTDPIAHHVVHIGIDGLRPDCIELAPGGAPNLLTRFRSEGTSTLTLGRTVSRAMSLMGWSATLTAMPPELTGVKSNFWTPPWLDPPNTTYPDTHLTPVMGNEVAPPVVFQILEEQEPEIETAAFYGNEFFEFFTDVGYPGVVDTIFKCYEDNSICDPEITENVVFYLQDILNNTDISKSYTFIVLANVDTTGHARGWCDTEYSDAVATMDSQIGEILDTIENSAAADDTLVMFSADHGGRGRYHGRMQDDDLMIPMFVKGPGIKQNYEFTYKVRNMDMVPTAVRVLGLEPSLWWEGTVMQEAFEDGVL